MAEDRGLRPRDTIIELTANVDDMTAEEIGYAFDRILKAGAVDVYALPAVMKKNRPGTILNVLCREEDRDRVVDAVFLHTRTIGIREKLMERYVLNRSFSSIHTPEGDVRVKTVSGYGVCREKPEYDDLAALAEKKKISIREAGDYAEKFAGKD